MLLLRSRGGRERAARQGDGEVRVGSFTITLAAKPERSYGE